jgi:AP-2 complex subunit mu-1
VTGKILMKCFLSGMPDLKLGLNDKIGLEKEAQLKSRPAKRYITFLVIIKYIK